MSSPKYKDVAIDNLLLDSENPRIEGAASQRECVNAMLGWDTRKIEVLAQHIVAAGGTNPSELPIVMAKGKQFVVLEGNRRLTALKLLAKPSLADDPAVEKRFAVLSEGDFELPESLLCHLVTSREEARPWIEIRHTGEREGAGVVPWDAFMREKWEQAEGHDSKALLFAEMAAAIGSGDEEFETQLRAVVDTRFTNLTRLASDPAVRAALGIDIKAGQVYLLMDKSRVRKGVKRIVKELNSDSGKVSNVYRKEDRKALLTKMAKDLPDPGKHMLDSPAPIDGAAIPPAKQKKPARKPPRPKRHRVLAGLQLDHADHRIHRILEELQRLSPESAPNTSAVMLRVIVELLVDSALDSNGWKQDNTLKKRIKTCLHQLDPTEKDKALSGVRLGMADPKSLMSVTTLNTFVHGRQTNPDPEWVIDISENHRHFIELLDQAIAP